MHTILNHPIIDDCMARLRHRETPVEEFRRIVRQIAMLMVPAVTQNLSTKPTSIPTPLETTELQTLATPITLCPILRAGLGMLDGFHTLLPQASVAHIGLARNEKTLQPESYYFNSPQNIADTDVLILDPMLATGGSASAAIKALKEHGAKSLRFICLLAAPEGIDRLTKDHPDTSIYAANLDRELNPQGYILPGLGDAGDRIFGTL